MTLKEIYNAIPKRVEQSPKEKWVKELAEVCCVAPSTVKCWLSGHRHPDELRKRLIAQHLGRPIEELFVNQVGSY